MAGTGGRLGRIAAMTVALAIGLLLVVARGAAGAGLYTVVQCGWGAGVDATWSDTTGGVVFAPEVSCPPSEPGSLGAGHVGALTGAGGAVVGGGLAAWRWVAPAGTGIVAASGYWWQDPGRGIERRLGVEQGDASFGAFATATGTNLVPTPFAATFATPLPAFEDQLVCGVAGRPCAADRQTRSALRGLIFGIEDMALPAGEIGGELLAGGWRRGLQNAAISGTDLGSGVRFAEVRIDGRAVASSEFPCAEVFLGSWVGTQMQPCQSQVTGTLQVATENFGDGPHGAALCVIDFAEDPTCTAEHRVLTDNTPPDSPRELTVTDDRSASDGGAYDVAWTNPYQGPASPIAAALWQVTGPDDYATGVEVAAETAISSLAGLRVPRPGAYTLRVWLRDEAGNGSRTTAVTVPLRGGAHARGPEAAVGGGHHGGGPGKGAKGRARDGGGAKVRLSVHLRSGGAAGASAGDRRDARRISGPDGSLTVPFGAGATVAGRLTNDAGNGIAGRRLVVVARPWRGAHSTTTRQTVTTGRHGGFELPLAPGPSRRVAVRFAGGDGLAAARHEGLDLLVRTGVSLSAAPAALRTGQEVHLRGRVRRRGAAIPHPGKLVAIQYLEAATHRWRPALVVRSDRHGHFDTSYRFRYVSGTARIRLRATALAEDGWPYAPGSSPPVTVDVRGG